MLKNGIILQDMSEHIYNYLYKVRTLKKVTQEELAESVGVSRQTVIAIEKGNYAPSVLLAIKIAKYFNSTVEELFIIER